MHLVGLPLLARIRWRVSASGAWQRRIQPIHDGYAESTCHVIAGIGRAAAHYLYGVGARNHIKEGGRLGGRG